MKISIATSDLPEALARETLLLGFFSDERPPKGYGGFVDWRLNGAISSALAAGRISGGFAEKAAFAFPKRLRISRLILLGLGDLVQLTYEKLYNGGYEMALTAGGLAATDIGLPVPCAGRGSLALAGATEALFTGFFDGWVQGSLPLDALRLEIPARPDHAGEIRRGLDRFVQQVGDQRVMILGPGEVAMEAEASCAGGPWADGAEALRP